MIEVLNGGIVQVYPRKAKLLRLAGLALGGAIMVVALSYLTLSIISQAVEGGDLLLWGIVALTLIAPLGILGLLWMCICLRAIWLSGVKRLPMLTVYPHAIEWEARYLLWFRHREYLHFEDLTELSLSPKGVLRAGDVYGRDLWVMSTIYMTLEDMEELYTLIDSLHDQWLEG